MAINIQHVYATHVEISYLDPVGNYALKEQVCGPMDEIADYEAKQTKKAERAAERKAKAERDAAKREAEKREAEKKEKEGE